MPDNLVFFVALAILSPANVAQDLNLLSVSLHKELTMLFAGKLILTNLVIIGCAQIGKKYPSLAGLIATMPITTLAVMIWIHAEKPSDTNLLQEYTRGVLWGIIPTALFFGAALFCFKRGLPVPTTIAVSFLVWLTSAALHQCLLK